VVRGIRLALGLAVAVLVSGVRGTGDLQAQWQAAIVAEGTAFQSIDSGDYASRGPGEAALVLGASFFVEWDDGRYRGQAEPFVRWDPSGESTRVDFRDLSVSAIGQRWEVALGMKEVPWGAAESRRLVDLVNQRDLVGGGDDYLRMGQLMIDVTAIRRWGTIDVLLLPWFRERTFDGHSGWLWSPLPVEADRTVFGPGAGTGRLDWAVRWAHTLGPVDLGISHLQGNLREPGFIEIVDSGAPAVLAPRYDAGGQTGMDVQLAAGGLLWKFEAVTAAPQPRRYVAGAGGVEYGVGDYLAVFVEYAWDSRGREATTSFGDDVFVGGRLFLPDGQVHAGAYIDRRTANTALSAAVDWRLGSAITLGVEAGAFLGDPALEPPFARRQQTRLAVRVSRYF
jgi:hypothetical protein